MHVALKGLQDALEHVSDSLCEKRCGMNTPLSEEVRTMLTSTVMAAAAAQGQEQEQEQGDNSNSNSNSNSLERVLGPKLWAQFSEAFSPGDNSSNSSNSKGERQGGKGKGKKQQKAGHANGNIPSVHSVNMTVGVMLSKIQLWSRVLSSALLKDQIFSPITAHNVYVSAAGLAHGARLIMPGTVFALDTPAQEESGVTVVKVLAQNATDRRKNQIRLHGSDSLCYAFSLVGQAQFASETRASEMRRAVVWALNQYVPTYVNRIIEGYVVFLDELWLYLCDNYSCHISYGVVH